MKKRLEHAAAFIARLHPRMSYEAVVQLTALRRHGPRMHTRELWLWSPGQPVLTELLQLNEQGWDCFLSVNPCATLAGRKKENIAYAHTVCIDVDSKKTGVPLENNIAWWTRFGLEPSLIVTSGNGGHLYFQLTGPVPISIAEQIGKRMCTGSGTDHIYDCTRVLRLPGTVNWKTPPRWCEWVTCSDQRYTPDELTALLDRAGFPALEEAPPIAVTLAPVPATVAAAVERVPLRIRALIETGDTTGFPSNSEADFAAMHALVTAGCTDEQVTAVYAGYPIRAAKVAREGGHYFARTLAAARELAVAEAIAREEQANLPQPPFVQTGPGRMTIRMTEAYSAEHFYDGL